MALGFAALVGLDQPSRVLLSNILGYASIACWLCAQFPQVIKNASLKSCEGLALPFLCNWLFGDITNLIGCLLTDQLPFQTYLAAYFCVVDIALVAQYFYYRSPPAAPPAPRYISYSSLSESPRQSIVLPPQSAPPHPPHPHHRTRSSSDLAQPPLSAGPGPSPGLGGGPRGKPGMKRRGSQYFPPDISVTSPADGSYAAIYSAALDVARAAERASARTHSRKRKPSYRNTAATVLGESGGEGGGETGEAGGDGEGAEGEVDSAMLDSFHSEMSGQSGSTTRGSPRRGVAHAFVSGGRGTGVVDDRGRSMRRAAGGGAGGSGYTSGYNGGASEDTSGNASGSASGNVSGNTLSGLSSPMLEAYNSTEDVREWDRKRSKSRSQSLVRGSGGRGGRRAAGMAFMSLGVLVGWGRLTGGTGGTGGVGAGGGAGGDSARTGGMVLTQASPWPILRHPQIATHFTYPYAPGHSSTTYLVEFLDTSPSLTATPADADATAAIDGSDGQPTHDHPGEEAPSYQRIVGRISAWSCTTLYLTSRLPQIWKNFQRKSVEGLSILLFLFAFCGNSTYVTSILLNPAGTADPSESAHYLLEALPYLLGSGGTLMFDLTIMAQSVIYGSSPPVPQPPTPLDRSARRRILSSRRRARQLEEGWGSAAVSQERGGGAAVGLPGGGVGERQALLGISGLPRRERSISPQVSTRRARGTSAVRA